MNLRERAWRRRVLKLLQMLDGKIEILSREQEHLSMSHIMNLRERLAGSLGAEEGFTSTYELRKRTASDYAEAERILGLEPSVFLIPPARPIELLMEKDLNSFRRPWPKTGDMC